MPANKKAAGFLNAASAGTKGALSHPRQKGKKKQTMSPIQENKRKDDRVFFMRLKINEELENDRKKCRNCENPESVRWLPTHVCGASAFAGPNWCRPHL